jgi:hypothetical protein
MPADKGLLRNDTHSRTHTHGQTYFRKKKNNNTTCYHLVVKKKTLLILLFVLCWLEKRGKKGGKESSSLLIVRSSRCCYPPLTHPPTPAHCLTVGVDVELHGDLGNAARRRGDAGQLELPQQVVVARHRALALDVALQLAFERQTLKPVFSLDRLQFMGLKDYRLWAMGQLDSTCRAPPRTPGCPRRSGTSCIRKQRFETSSFSLFRLKAEGLKPGACFQAMGQLHSTCTARPRWAGCPRLSGTS